MRYTWKGRWKQGEIIIETDNLSELTNTLETLMPPREQGETTSEGSIKTESIENYPAIDSGLGCSEAIRQILSSDWGRQQPRTMGEIDEALKTNALYFSSGGLSGTLNLLTKAGSIRRIKQGGKWAYIIGSRNV